MNQTMKLKNLRCQHCLFHLKNLQSSFSKSILVRSTVRSGAKGHSSILNRNYSTNRTVESWVLPCSPPTPGWLHSYSQCQQTALPLQTLKWASHLSLLYPCTGKSLKARTPSIMVRNSTDTDKRAAEVRLVWAFFLSWLWVCPSSKNRSGCQN